MTIEEYQQEVKRIRPGLCRTAIRYLGEADGEDAVEVTLVRLWQMAGDLRAPIHALAQTVWQLRHINGMEMAQVAELTGMKEPAVRKCLSRARLALRTLMLRKMKEA